MSNSPVPIAVRRKESTYSIVVAGAARTTGTHAPVPVTVWVTEHVLPPHPSNVSSEPLATRTKNSTIRCGLANCRYIGLHGRYA